MAELKQFKLPDVGEGLTEGEILRWLVKPGDRVTDGQMIVEVETAKAAVELPSPFDGVVTELHVSEGTTVDVGAPIVTVDVDPDGSAPAVTKAEAGGESAVATSTPRTVQSGAEPRPTTRPSGDDLVPDLPVDDEAEEAVEPGLIGGAAPGGRTSVLVGYGPRSTAAVRRPRRASGAGAESGSVARAARGVPATGRPLAKPPVRKLAKELGIDLDVLAGSGPGGTIARDDVLAVSSAAAPAAAADAVATPTPGREAISEPTFGPDRERRIPIKGVRKHTALAMVASAFTAPHVTEFLTIDITPAMELRTRIAASRAFAGVKVSPLLLVAKAMLIAARRHPLVNSSWDEERQEIVVKDYVNLGIAAATDRGLIVPNIKDAGRLSLRELADGLDTLVATARSGKTPPADMADGTMSITNVGVFGVDTGTPILPPGETVILAFGAVRDAPWVVDGQIAVRQVTQLAVSFDHRIVDGALGSQFLADVGAVLSDPAMALVLS